jgi:hypothetical protein
MYFSLSHGIQTGTGAHPTPVLLGIGFAEHKSVGAFS